MNNLNPNSSEVAELNEQLRLLSIRFIKAQNDLSLWKLNFDMRVVPDAQVVELRIFKDGNLAGGIKEIPFATLLEYADDLEPIIDAVSEQFIDLLLRGQIKAEIRHHLKNSFPNIVKINATR